MKFISGKEAFVKNKISLCTVSMNRLHHIERTLPRNIEDNLDYENVEFVLLNYNSSDGLDEFVLNELNAYIERGILTYIKTTEPVFFHRSHSRNVAFKAASGDILCNVDADNFTGKGFAKYVNKKFNEHPEIFLVPSFNKQIRDVVGRICVRKTDFIRTRGYDEAMSDYGYEDNDFYNRLKLIGLRELHITESIFLKTISHPAAERFENERTFRLMKDIYLHFITPEKTAIIVLNTDKTFFRGTLVTNDAKEGAYSIPQILEGNWIKGIYNEDAKHLSLRGEEKNESFTFNDEHSTTIISSDTLALYWRLNDPEFIHWLLFRIPLITNNQRLIKNQTERLIVANKDTYGQANLIKNFENRLVIP